MSSNLLIMVAMAAEAAPTIARLSLKQTPFPSTKLPYLLYTGTHNSTPITLCTLGSNKFGVDNVGTLHAGIALSHLLESAEMPYTAVLNVGTCGGFKAQVSGPRKHEAVSQAKARHEALNGLGARAANSAYAPYRSVRASERAAPPFMYVIMCSPNNRAAPSAPSSSPPRPPSTTAASSSPALRSRITASSNSRTPPP